ncbi:MAG: hypothetical protein ACR2IE_18405 [Candidatus Sumerlaeaceae bacterium]
MAWRCQWKEIGDDALITMRYAWNLVAGNGLVYNPGEHVLGTTTPLYALVLAAFMVAGAVPWIAALVLDAICAWLLSIVVYLICKRAWNPQFAAAAVLLMLCDPCRHLSVGGMETGLFSLLVYGSFLALCRARFGAAIVLSLFAVFTRPEGFLAWALVLCFSVARFPSFRLRRGYGSRAAIATVPLALAIACLVLYYGSPLPQSMMAKQTQSMAAGRGGRLPLFVTDFGTQMFHTFGVPDYAWGVAQILGVVFALVRCPRLRPVFAWGMFYLAFMAIGRAPNQYWYHQPLFPLQCVALAAFGFGAAELSGWLAKFVIPALSSAPEVKTAIAAIAILLVGHLKFTSNLQFYTTMFYRDSGLLDHAHYRDAALWMRSRAHPDDEIAAQEIGYVGMFSRHRIYDCMGLVSPDALKKYRKKDIATAVALRGCRFFVVNVATNRLSVFPPAFLANYKPVWVRLDRRRSTVVFERSRDPVLQIIGSASPGSAGYFPRLAGYDYAISTTAEGNGTKAASFGYVGNLRSLDLKCYAAPRELIRGGVKLGWYTSSQTGPDGTSRLVPGKRISDGFILSVQSASRKAWIVLEDAEISTL